ncbi:phage tail sheath family protein [Hymenobacter sp. BT664]|uniref:Phage tail sheath family protein n=1 Tax=Hymenobacter montanus TaxID=2771359 RepID=A0A927GHT3_9BACT|nr:phage tail sheath C-terminal domain-containing protein [Hymenobacter montanus]MBD2766346.1 phage tail sheath family protein [Hymenobacter montanus]
MATSYKTPGVYVEEIPKFPPSVAPVETAIPAFVGYTQRAAEGKTDLTLKPVRITSLLEYEVLFGTTNAERFEVDVDRNPSTGGFQVDIVKKPTPAFILYYALQAFYANGGGPCYIISVGSFLDGQADINSILRGLAQAKTVDEVTLLVSPEAALLSDTQYGQWATAALQQCKQLQDRFTILDVSDKYKSNADVTAFFRNRIPSTVGEVKYGAAYYPFVETIFSYFLTDASQNNISFVRLYTENGRALSSSAAEVAASATAYTTLLAAETTYGTRQAELSVANKAKAVADQINVVADKLAAVTTDVDAIKQGIYQAVGADNVDNTIKNAADATALAGAVDAWLTNKTTELTAATTAFATAETALNTARGTMSTDSNAVLAKGDYSYTQLTKVKAKNNALYNLILDKIQASGVVLPPSSLIAGVYASVDNSRGVWKAPANVSLASVLQPTVLVSNDFQDALNVDTLAGKSVNAIRPFAGKGTLVWGARTLAGNDNEWRYVSVRRLFIFVEESIKKATEQFVFEPNDANTWVRAQAMIENFLGTLWRQGALQGIKPEHAFYVAVGLGKTMTALDILEGRLIIEIGMAAVRPAEFIILKFSHKMAES